MPIFRHWFQRNFPDPQMLILTFMLVFSATAISSIGRILIPVLASLVIACKVIHLMAPTRELCCEASRRWQSGRGRP